MSSWPTYRARSLFWSCTAARDHFRGTSRQCWTGQTDLSGRKACCWVQNHSGGRDRHLHNAIDTARVFQPNYSIMPDDMRRGSMCGQHAECQALSRAEQVAVQTAARRHSEGAALQPMLQCLHHCPTWSEAVAAGAPTSHQTCLGSHKTHRALNLVHAPPVLPGRQETADLADSTGAAQPPWAQQLLPGPLLLAVPDRFFSSSVLYRLAFICRRRGLMQGQAWLSIWRN